jgi:predicted nucleotide-binding protein
MTIIEKLEANSTDVGFAIAILTGDDVGYPKDVPAKLLPRARQNVILELGFFMAKISRGRVFALYEDGVELPSDFQGVVYTKLDSSGAWKYKLGKELRYAGFDIDLNKVGN